MYKFCFREFDNCCEWHWGFKMRTCVTVPLDHYCADFSFLN